jgi:hypothetical protein
MTSAGWQTTPPPGRFAAERASSNGSDSVGTIVGCCGTARFLLVPLHCSPVARQAINFILQVKNGLFQVYNRVAIL